MTCDCCGGKKKLFEIFYSEKEGAQKIRFCPDCWDVVERLKSDQPYPAVFHKYFSFFEELCDLTRLHSV